MCAHTRVNPGFPVDVYSHTSESRIDQEILPSGDRGCADLGGLSPCTGHPGWGHKSFPEHPGLLDNMWAKDLLEDSAATKSIINLF